MNQIEQKLNSREVAEMVEKPHNHLMKDIRRYIEQLGEGNLSHTDYFEESTYLTEQNKTLPCYRISKKGCEFIAHKLTGTKGTVFTARYIDKFHEMKESIKKPKSQLEVLQLAVNQMVEQERRLSHVEQKLVEVDAKLTTSTNDYYTIAGYASLRGKKVDVNKAGMLGRYATKLSKQYGYEVGKVKDVRFGYVNTYHLDVLKDAFRGM